MLVNVHMLIYISSVSISLLTSIIVNINMLISLLASIRDFLYIDYSRFNVIVVWIHFV